ncbi:MAG: DUF2867 domain-containing protein [Deltaproteobacteria bacterium]|nr:DUF2867 domain-containing protein [Deltaproteobacteria bacterium]
MNVTKQIPEIAALIEGSNYIDIKTIEGQTSLRQFVASMLSYYPWWIVLLYRIRAFLVKILGLVEHQAPEVLPHLQAEDVSFVVGDAVTFFIVRLAKEEQYWLAETPEDKHLSAFLGIVVEPIAENSKRFHVATIVRYKHWTGPVYFNLIRPFHHLVVSQMMRAGVAANPSNISET